jgi:hypothetical protein
VRVGDRGGGGDAPLSIAASRLLPARRAQRPLLDHRLFTHACCHAAVRAQVQQIDLLKVDVEGAELDVLQGIGASQWAAIKQVVAEVGARFHACVRACV